MRLLIQRVSQASVTINDTIESRIGKGLMVLIGIEEADTTEDIDWLSHKLLNLRIFDDEQGVMNLSALDTQADILVASQFTLHASTKKGNRPSYIRAARPDTAVPLYEEFIASVRKLANGQVGTGTFGAEMQVQLCNDGPVTIWIDSKNKE